MKTTENGTQWQVIDGSVLVHAINFVKLTLNDLYVMHCTLNHTTVNVEQQLRKTIDAYKIGEQTVINDLNKADEEIERLRKLVDCKQQMLDCQSELFGAKHDEVVRLTRADESNKHVIMTQARKIESLEMYKITAETNVKKLNIPWEQINPEYKFAAMDEDGSVDVYVTEPTCQRSRWSNGCEHKSLMTLNIDTDGIDWRKSLTVRPEGV